MFNLVVLTGRLTADPELKYTSNNIPVTSFSIAVDRRVRAGEEKQADFINIVAWRQTAEFVTKYFKKGSMIGIEGSIQTRKYADKDTGKNRTVFEVVANNVQFAESKKDNGQNASEDEPTPTFTQNVSSSAPSFQNGAQGEFTEISDDNDLPF